MYELEDNIDFYAELMKDDNATDLDEQLNNETLCLLTQQPLDKTALTLPCKHSFNYLPLFNEVKIQKNPKKNNPHYLDAFDTNKPYSHGMNCPYCRTKHSFILPQCYKIPNTKSNVALVNKKTTSHIPFDVYCEYNDNAEYCDDVYVTNVGKYCKHHYEIVVKEKKKAEREALKKQQNSVNANASSINLSPAKPKKVEQCISLIEPINYNLIDILKALKVTQLKEFIKENKLKFSGKKENLINSLHNYYYYTVNIDILFPQLIYINDFYLQ